MIQQKWYYLNKLWNSFFQTVWACKYYHTYEFGFSCIFQLSQRKEETNSETNKRLTLLKSALEESHKSIEQALGTTKPDFKPFPVDSENPNEQPKIKMSSILDHYSMQLSEKVFDLLKQRLDNESEDSKL